MPKYIQLLNWTQDGIKSIKDSPNRLDKIRAAEPDSNLEIYLTMGKYDQVVIFDAPDDEACAVGTLRRASAGFVRAVTLKAFTEDEYRKIIAAI